MTHRPSRWPTIAAALLAGGCGVASPPPRTVETPPPAMTVEAPPAKAGVSASASPTKSAAESKPAAKADARVAPPVSAPASKAPPPVAVRPPAPTLDLKSLEQRLKETSAIGVLTKLSLKNQVDDLVAKFRAFHGGQRPPTLVELRPSFDLLLMKVLSLLQDKDVALAKDIDASRNTIWNVLTDREKLATFN